MAAIVAVAAVVTVNAVKVDGDDTSESARGLNVAASTTTAAYESMALMFDSIIGFLGSIYLNRSKQKLELSLNAVTKSLTKIFE